MPYFTAPEEVLDYIHDLLEVEGGELGLRYVAYGEEDKIPRMPAARVVAGLLERSLHATRQFENMFSVDVFVYHGNLNATHAQRSKEDLELCSRIRNVIHAKPTLGGGVIQGWITAEAPLLTTRGKAPAVVTTQMTWRGIAIESFPM